MVLFNIPWIKDRPAARVEQSIPRHCAVGSNQLIPIGQTRQPVNQSETEQYPGPKIK